MDSLDLYNSLNALVVDYLQQDSDSHNPSTRRVLEARGVLQSLEDSMGTLWLKIVRLNEPPDDDDNPEAPNPPAKRPREAGSD